jgi:hypothetical protein
MGERKVLNKYYPADFDPALLPRNKKPRDQQIKVRTMLPMSICCTTCGEYLYKGKKFNAKKETCLGEDYLGIEIYRFYIRCTNCSSEITFKTDPKKADYTCEFGASRNVEPWRKEENENEEAKKKREEEDADSMKALENKTIDNRQEMDILDALDELKSLKARREQLSFDEVLQANGYSEQVDSDGLTSEDRKYIQKVFADRKEMIYRLDEEEKKEEAKVMKRKRDTEGPTTQMKRKAKSLFPTIVVKKATTTTQQIPQTVQQTTPLTNPTREKEDEGEESHEGITLLQGYSSGEKSE